MDGHRPSISSFDLYPRLGSAGAPIVLDIGPAIPAEDDRLIVSALFCSPDEVSRRSESLRHHTVVVYARNGGELDRRVAGSLSSAGVESAYLEGGFAAWTASGLPTQRNIGSRPGKWITRERPKIDRIACPWLIRRFIDPEAEFIYVPETEVLSKAKEIGATPYDAKGVKFTHEGERCSFDTILRIYDIRDAALDHLSTIVRGADTSRHDLTPQCGGLFAISLGLSANFADDHEMLKHGMVMYDALYTWCRSLQHETHNWPVVKTQG